MRFLNFFFIPVVQEYLNEISPTLHGPKKLKTSGKPLRIADLQPPASGQDNPATLYIMLFYPTIGSKYFAKTQTYVALFGPHELSLIFAGGMCLEQTSL